MKSSSNCSSRVQPATIAIIAFAYFVVAVTALYFLNPAYNIHRSFMGNYDLGSYEFLIASTFFSLGLGSLALVVGLYQRISQSVCSWIGLLLLGIWGVGMLIAGIFPANEGGSTVHHMTTVPIAGVFPIIVEASPETVFSFIHILAILGSLFSLSLAAISLSWRLKQDEKWHPFHRLTFILALLMLTASILICSVLFLPAGILPRYLISGQFIFIDISIVIGLIWLLLMAVRLRFIGVSSVSN